jgi:hypothetical protein
MMPNLLFLWSEMRPGPGEGRSISEWLKSFFPEEDASHALSQEAGNDPANYVRDIGVLSVQDLVDTFRGLAKGATKFDAVTFTTHGGPGSIRLGAEDFDAVDCRDGGRFKGCEELFNQGCSIKFLGCEVAQGADGEEFLVEIGKSLLLERGGTVSGCSTYAYQNPFTNYPHLLGPWVTAQIGPGGTYTLINATHLDPKELNRRMQDAYYRARVLFPNPGLKNADTDQATVLDGLADVGHYLSNPSILNLKNASATMDRVEACLEGLERKPLNYRW